MYGYGTSGSDSSESENWEVLFPAAAENAAKNCVLTDDPIEDEPKQHKRLQAYNHGRYIIEIQFTQLFENIKETHRI